MSDLISRQALIEALRKDKDSIYSHVFCIVDADAEHDLLLELEQMINNQPQVEAVPVVHGEWFFTEYEYFTCSCCGGSYYNGSDSTMQTKSYLDNGQYYKFCPHCGADMRKGLK